MRASQMRGRRPAPLQGLDARSRRRARRERTLPPTCVPGGQLEPRPDNVRSISSTSSFLSTGLEM